MIHFIIATRNRHKVDEIRSILGGDSVVSLQSLADLPTAPAVIEDAPTFAGNATKKSVQLARWISSSLAEGLHGATWILADDSGLEVDALGGAPGVHSARFAAKDSGNSGNTPDKENTNKLLRLLDAVADEQRAARFRCVIAVTPVLPAQPQNSSPVCDADEFELQTVLFDGKCEGRIQRAPSGSGGFGYDPVFVPNGYSQTFAELGEETKNQISHRARALGKLKEWLNGGRAK